MLAVWLIAQDAPSDIGTWFQILNLGVAGVGLWLFATGRIVHGKALEEERAERQALQQIITEQVVPALTRATDAMRAAQARAEEARKGS